MLQGHTILCLAYCTWADQITDWELMRRFARTNKVVFVEIQEKYENLRALSIGRREYLKKFVPQPLHWINDNLVVIKSPGMLPLHVFLLSRVFRQAIGRLSITLSKRIFERHIKHQLSKLCIQPSILWFHQPQDTLLAGKFDEKLVCYRTFDELSLFPSNAPFRTLLDDLERENIGKVDLIFASSRSQYEKRKALCPNTYLLPNAVDFELFSKAKTCEYAKPADLQGTMSPVIGFMGTIDFRFDFDLVRTVATCRPEWSVVLIGLARQYAGNRVRQLAKLPNIHWLGHKHREKLPQYLRFFDVVIIPYLVTPVTSTMYPWKLHEYLAAGLPVVSTNLHEVQPFHEVVRLALSPEEFVTAIDEELRINSPAKAQRRMEIARENSWETRVEEMSRLIEEYFDILGRSTRGRG